MQNFSRSFLTLALLAVVLSFGLTACQKSEQPPAAEGKSTNATPEKNSEHPEHPKNN